jgi:serine/threonine protein phosphatase 1
MASDQKYIVVGDIHGCSSSLTALLEKLEPHLDRTIVFLGDYIDRGYNSYGVVETLVQFDKEHDCVFLRGNHEQMLLDALFEGDRMSWEHWFMNGGSTTVDSYERVGTSILEAAGHADFYAATELYFETTDYLFVHGGINPHLSVAENIAQTDPYEFLWERRHIESVRPTWEKVVVFGHTPRRVPIIELPLIGLDTGCVFVDRGYGKLTAMLLPEMNIIDVTCNDSPVL